MRWFRRKAAGGLGFEDTLRRLLNRGRYAERDDVAEHTASTTRSTSSSVMAEPLGRHRPVRKISSATRPPRIAAVGEHRLQVHRLPRGARLDVERLEVLADRGRRRAELVLVDGGDGEPVGGHAVGRVGHEPDARRLRPSASR